MKISIITVVYNNKNSIEDTINSVLCQSYSEIEYIVIDGGSTDGTVDLIEKYRDRISYYISEPDNGLYSALNKGVKASTGDVVGILHSDDLFYSNNAISSFVKVFKEKNADLVYANGVFVSKENPSIIKRIYKGKEFKKKNLKYGWMPLHTTIFLKKEVFKKHGFYSEAYSIAGDYEMCLKWFKDDSLKKVFLNEMTVKMRLGGKSTTANLQLKKSKEDLKIINKNNLLGIITLLFKIVRKIPQYISPKLRKN